MPRIYAFDTETYYSKDYSITELGNYGYTHHPEFECYLVTLAGDDGNKFAGHPLEFDWACLEGSIFISHNATFDSAVYERMKELHPEIYFPTPVAWYDTADLAVYLGAPRNLAGAAKQLLGIEVSKQTRNDMKGKRWATMTPEFQKEVKEYAIKDAELCLELWLKFSDRWPEWERRLSVHTREMCWRGLPVNIEGIREDVKFLETRLWSVRKLIPWADAEDAKVLSPKAMAIECRKHGVEPPKSMAKDSEEFETWLEVHGATLPFARAMGEYRRVNTMLLKFKTMADRTKPDGWMPYALKYGGAHTLRWSGDSGWNGQTMARDPWYFTKDGLTSNPNPAEVIGLVDMRRRVRAPEGKVFVVCDLSNIEPRSLAVLCGDEPTLAALRTGIDIYESHARATMGYNKPEKLKDGDPSLRHRAKTRVLGLGYGCGWLKFVTFAKQLLPAAVYKSVFGSPVTAMDTSKFLVALSKRRKDGPALLKQFQAMPPDEQCYWVNSFLQVEQFRATNPKITGFWVMLEGALKRVCGTKEFTMGLPSGREMRYLNPKNYGGLSAEIPRMGRLMRLSFHGGVLCENVTQATARDIFGDCLLRLEDAGYQVVLHAHDEAVCLVDEVTAEQDRVAIEAIMSTAPVWMPTLPQAAEAHICKEYCKS